MKDQFCGLEQGLRANLKVDFTLCLLSIQNQECLRTSTMSSLHTMPRIIELDDSLDFFCNKRELVEVSRKDSG